MAKLTKALVEATTTHDKEFLGDEEVKGFGLRFLGSESRNWIYHYRNASNAWKQLKIGEVEVLTLAMAREQARSAAAKVQMGDDPAAERDAKRRSITVRQLAEVFDDLNIGLRVKPSTAAEYRRALKIYILPAIGSKPVAEVTRQDIALTPQSWAQAHPSQSHHRDRVEDVQLGRGVGAPSGGDKLTHTSATFVITPGHVEVGTISKIVPFRSKTEACL